MYTLKQLKGNDSHAYEIWRDNEYIALAMSLYEAEQAVIRLEAADKVITKAKA